MPHGDHSTDLLDPPDPPDDAGKPELLTAAEAAVLLRVERAWVYAHARELGGWRLLGDRGSWRFSRRRLLDGPPAATGPRPAIKRQRARRAPVGTRPEVELLPIASRRVRSV